MTDAEVTNDAPAGFSDPARPRTTQPAIADYALIGDCRTAALVSRSGSVDWMCLPDFSSPSVFAALLDVDKGGQFALAPTEPFKSERRYIGETAVLETRFTTSGGIAAVVDSMPLGDPGSLRPERELLRIVEGIEGRVPFEMRFDPRPGYARKSPTMRRHSDRAFTCNWDNQQLLLRCDSPIDATLNSTGCVGRFEVRAGQQVCLSLAFSKGEMATILPMEEAAKQRLEQTEQWWTRWAERCSCDTLHRDAVLRSAVTLKLMTFPLTGAVIAAPTTSLPEAIGGNLNWDYRYCWLRDASLTMGAFLALDLLDEAAAFLRWLLHATALTRPRLHVMYDLYGRTGLTEKTLDYFSGYRGSRPVRIGNGAHDQRQLDVYGELIAAAVQYHDAGGTLQPDQLSLLAGFGRTVCRIWRKPGHGIWELRGKTRHYTFSKLMCWVALERLIHLSREVNLPIARDSFESERDAIRATIEEHAWNEERGAYCGELGGDWLDASVLLMSNQGFADADSPRMRSTFDAIEANLGCDGLIYRFEHRIDPGAPREGAFGICSFWAVEQLAMRGDIGEAEAHFRDLLARANDLGLFAEEIEPRDGAFLGNYPQAFTHVGLINAAIAIQNAKRKEERQ